MYKFLRRQVRWSSIPIEEFSTVYCDPQKGFSVVNEVEVVVFLEFPCFLYDPVDVGNLISGSSAFSKSSLYIWKFLVHITQLEVAGWVTYKLENNNTKEVLTLL